MFNPEFIKSITNVSESPNKKGLGEVAFWGRSNVGKSTLINILTNKKALSKISNTPGKTKCLNYFLLGDKMYMVDLPGYGYAKVSFSERKKWKKFTTNYLTNNHFLKCLFLLIDSRLQPQQIDLQHCAFLVEENIPFAIIFTKIDKQKSYKVKILEDLFKDFFYQHFKRKDMIFFKTNQKNKLSVLPLKTFISSLY